jgi:D-alanyl-lipoteichoic acid acyltransferase DltB (MBOAT superfamily)
MNFNSPYQSLNIREFWHRWHITLSHFLRDYLYIPLGGNRTSEIKIYCNLILTFMLGGFWHGAGWTFILWGLLHGIGISVVRFFSVLKIELPKILAWFITFNFINITWIFFRADNVNQALTLLSHLFNFMDIQVTNHFLATILLLLMGFIIILRLPNSAKLIANPALTRFNDIPWISFLMVFSMIAMEISNSHEFIYFRF